MKDYIMTEVYSTDGETFNEDFPDDLEVGANYFKGNSLPVKFSDLIDVHSIYRILEEAEERYFDLVGEIAFDADLKFKDKSEYTELMNIINEYLEKKIELKYYRVTNIVGEVHEGDE